VGYAKPTAARLIDQRARRRATQALIDLHRDEFRDLYEWHRRNATTEARVLATKAAETHPSTEPPRLMTGARKPGQDVTERIDVARCPHCVRHHDSGHVCANCGAVPSTVAALPDDGDVDEIAVERAINGEPTALTPSEQREAFRRMATRGDSDSIIATRLGVASRTVMRWRKAEGIESTWAS
jgi:hypothetical protein